MPQRENSQQHQRAWATAAVLCAGVVRGEEGKTFVDVFESIQVDPESVGRRSPAVLFVSLAPERLPDPGEHEVQIVANLPDGQRESVGGARFTFDPRATGHDLSSSIAIPLAQDGRIWFDILLDNHVVTRTPLRIIHLADATGST
jgi:hypothetical protein